MYRIKKVDVLSVAKMQAFLMMAGFGVWIILLLAIQLLSGSSYMIENMFNPDIQDLGDIVFSGFSILTLPAGLIFGGIIGFISGALCALVYNLIAVWLGGIKVDITLEQEEPTEPTTPPTNVPPPTQ